MPVKVYHRLLVQRTPVTTVATKIYQPPSDTRAEIKTIVVCNTTSSATSFSIYIDRDGSKASSSTALYEGVSLAANSTTVIALEGDASFILESSSSTLSVKSGTASSVTFTFFGLEIEET